ncbi:MAG TPA: sugar phosphate nucleotidyltransferase [Candidatus Binatia bacterium]|jgi:NDP-sugar pyrophosphorylase family protein
MTALRSSAAGLRAVILAGGKGTRLKPFTANFPKPLVPVGDRPILELLIRRLIQFEVTDITLSLGHLAELIKAYFACHPRLTEQLKLRYVQEEEPTGTAGSLALVPDLDRTFLVMNGDLLTNLDFDALVKYHFEQEAVLTIATSARKVKIDLGVLEFDHTHRLTGYIEKPEHNYYVSMGVYVYEPEVLRFIEPGCYLDFPDLVLRLLEKKQRVCSFPTDCLWLDVGRPDDYAKAQELFAENKGAFNGF